MPTATETFERYKNSSEQALSRILPVLDAFRQHHVACRKDGYAMHPGSRAHLLDALASCQMIGGPVSDPSSVEAARLARKSCEALIEQWDANEIEIKDVKTSAPSDEFEAILAVIDDPRLAEWRHGQPLMKAYETAFREIGRKMQVERDAETAFREIGRKMQVERDAETRAKKRSSIGVGTEVTLTILSGEPVATTTVAGGSAADGFVCQNGTRLTFDETGGGDWLIEPIKGRKGQDFFSTAACARPTVESDRRMIAAVLGLLGDDRSEQEPGELPWPKSDFVARTGFWNRNTQMGIGNGPNTSILIAEILPDADYGTLLAYMTRRFGPPYIRSLDHYKDMTGAWCLTTPMPDMWVMASPSLSGINYSFRLHMTREAEAELRALKDAYLDEMDGEKSGLGASEAYLAALAPRTRALRGFFLDLLRPVWVRDVPMNIEGRLDDDNPVCEWGEDEDHPDGGAHIHGVDYAKSSTYALPETVLAARDVLDRLLKAAWNLAPGDYAEAMTQAAEALEKLALEKTPTHGNDDDGETAAPASRQ